MDENGISLFVNLTFHVLREEIQCFANVCDAAMEIHIFRNNQNTPKYINYLGKALPGAIFAMLVIYCLKDVNVLRYPYGLYELTAIIITIGLHLMKRNMLISILGGTLSYIIMVNPDLPSLL